MNIHLFVSGKGGVGKTTLSASLAMYARDKNYRVLCIDKNWQNPDFSTLLFADSDYQDAGSYQYSNQARVTSIRPTDIYEIPNGICGFWSSIADTIERELNRQSNIDLIIIDSCLHVNNLVSLRNYDQNLIEIAFEKLREVKVSSLNIWFIWTLTALHRRNETIWVQKTLESLSDVSSNLFNISRNLIHVINPYTVYSSSGLGESFKSLFRNEPNKKEFDSLKGLLASNVSNPMEFDDFLAMAQSASNGQRAEPEILLENIGKNIYNSMGKMRPRNILPIPIFSPNIRPDAISDINEVDKISVLSRKLGPSNHINTLSGAIGRVLDQM